MIIKRFKAKSMRSALQKVRHELGPDAVILSNQEIGNEVELMAATDVDWPAGSASTAAPVGRYPGNDELMPDNLALHPASENATRAGESTRPAAMAVGGAEGDGSTITSLASASRAEAARVSLVDNADQVGVTPREQQISEAGHRELSAEIQSLRGLVERQLSSLAWGTIRREQPHRAELMERLLAFGLDPVLCGDLADESGNAKTLKEAWKWVMTKLVSMLPGPQEDLIEDGGIVALVGPTGVGKTTTIAKLAGQTIQRHGPGSVALITIDGFRIGTQEQLRAFGQILDIPVCYAENHADLQSRLEHFADRRLVLIDTNGISHRDPGLLTHMAMLTEGMPESLKRYLVLSANTETRSLKQSLTAFSRFDIRGTIITKLDEAESLGGLISGLVQNAQPLCYTTHGQRVPDDLLIGDAHSLVKQGITLMRDHYTPMDPEVSSLTFGHQSMQRYA